MDVLAGSVENKVLIAVDLSENSLKAVEYVGGMLRCHDTAEITLLTVIKEPSPDIVPEEAVPAAPSPVAPPLAPDPVPDSPAPAAIEIQPRTPARVSTRHQA